MEVILLHTQAIIVFFRGTNPTLYEVCKSAARDFIGKWLKGCSLIVSFGMLVDLSNTNRDDSLFARQFNLLNTRLFTILSNSAK